MGNRLLPHRHRKAQQRRALCLAQRRPAAHDRRSSRQPPRRAPALELAANPRQTLNHVQARDAYAKITIRVSLLRPRLSLRASVAPTTVSASTTGCPRNTGSRRERLNGHPLRISGAGPKNLLSTTRVCQPCGTKTSSEEFPIMANSSPGPRPFAFASSSRILSIRRLYFGEAVRTEYREAASTRLSASQRLVARLRVSGSKGHHVRNLSCSKLQHAHSTALV
jgi:hypothetical protein